MKSLLFLLCFIALLSASPVSVNSGSGHMGGVTSPKENYCTVCNINDNNGGYVELKGFTGSEYIRTLICPGRNPTENPDALSFLSPNCPCTVLLFVFFF
jgi:hypothetical protein